VASRSGARRRVPTCHGGARQHGPGLIPPGAARRGVLGSGSHAAAGRRWRANQALRPRAVDSPPSVQEGRGTEVVGRFAAIYVSKCPSSPVAAARVETWLRPWLPIVQTRSEVAAIGRLCAMHASSRARCRLRSISRGATGAPDTGGAPRSARHGQGATERQTRGGAPRGVPDTGAGSPAWWC
jgi:hypothetical protein